MNCMTAQRSLRRIKRMLSDRYLQLHYFGNLLEVRRTKSNLLEKFLVNKSRAKSSPSFFNFKDLIFSYSHKLINLKVECVNGSITSAFGPLHAVHVISPA